MKDMQGTLRRLSRGIPTVEHVWYGGGAGSILVRAALWPVARVYDAAMSVRSRLYDSGVLDAVTPDLPTISVGNLTVGGTGKTPFSAWLAFKLKVRAHPAIALRGYGDDETQVHARLNPDVPVVVNPDRGAAIREAKKHGADIVVLDDAFQHRRIARNVDIVILSAEQLLRPHRMLPAGPWRERLPAARRADLLVVTRKTATHEQTERAQEMVRIAIPDVPIVVAYLGPDRLMSVTDDEIMPTERLRGATVVAVAAIGEPELFKTQLEELGAHVTITPYRDHHTFSEGDVTSIAASVPADGFAVCTLKDAVKLAGRWPGPGRLWYVSQQLVVEQGAEDIDRLLKRALDARATATTNAS